MTRFFILLKSDFLLYISMFLLFTNYIFFVAFDWFLSDGFDYVKSVLRFVALGVLIIYLFQIGRIKKILTILIFFSLILFFINGNELLLNFLFIFLFFSVLLNIKLDDFVFMAFLFYLFYLFIHNLLYFLGVLSNEVTFFDGRERNSFGFTNVNRLAIFYFYLYLLSLYFIVTRKNIKYFFLCGILCLISIFYIYLSQSRTALFCCVLAVILICICRFNYFAKLNRFILNFLISFCFIFSLYLASSSALIYNELLSYRPYFFNKYISSLFSDTLTIIFGAPVSDNTTVDNSYLLFIGSFGFLFSIIFIVLSPLFSFKRYIPKEYLFLIISSLIYGIFESHLIRIEMMVPILILFCLFFSEKKNYF